MNQMINDCLASLNRAGDIFYSHAAGIIIQSTLLIIVLFFIDLLLRKRVRSVVRYCLWLLVLVKLVLPPTISLPTGIGYWADDMLPPAMQASHWAQDEIYFGKMPMHGQSMEVPELERTQSSEGKEVLARSELPISVRITWRTSLFLFWLIGVGGFLVLLKRRASYVRALIGASTPADENTQRLLAQCCQQIGWQRPVELRVTDAVPSPAVCGYHRPTVLIPMRLLNKLSPERLRSALIHELAHIKRGDLWINGVQMLIQAVYFYNPFVWFANAMIRRVCEEAVDETVLVTLGGDVEDYSDTLLDISETVFQRSILGLRLLGVAESRKALKWRIKHMLNRPIPKDSKLGVLGLSAILVLAAVLLPMAKAEKQVQDMGSVVTESQEKDTGSIRDAAGALPGVSAARSQMTLRLVKERKVGRYVPNYRYFHKRLSPDGLKVVFRNERDPNTIVVRDIASGVERKYEQTPCMSFPPVWSPDGKRLAFRDEKDAKPHLEGAVSILTLESGDVEKTEIHRGIPCDWSGDGRYLLVVDHFWDEEREGVQLINLETREKQTVVHPFKLLWYPELPRLSPDGKYVVYHIQEDGIFVQPIGSDEPIRIISDKEGGSGNWFPLWTADGKHILFAGSSEVGNSDLFSVAFQDGKPKGEPTTLVSGLAAGEPAHTLLYSCSNSGRLLYGHSSREGDIFSTNIDPVSGNVLGEPKQLTDDETTKPVPVWSRNGRYIAYWREASESEDPVLCVMNSDGSGKRTLGSVNRIRNVVAWHPDNDHILYSGSEADPENPGETLYGIYTVSIRSRERKLIYHDPDFKGLMNLSPDGKHLALTLGTEQKSQLYTVAYDGQNRRQLVESDGLVVGPYFTPDGKEIIYTFLVDAEEKDHRRSIMAVSSAGGEPRKIYASKDPNDFFDTYPSSWLPDGRFVFDIIRSGDRSQYAINMNGKSDPVRISDWLGGFQGLSPDGTKATFVGSYQNFKLWLMSDFLPND
jgi:beta-lactamase regulating signal transducer with metallopeptidase domain/Tol biopolymer transport system component